MDDDTLAFLQVVWRMEHALESASKRMEDAIGVSGPQRLALRLIGSHPGIGAGELAAALHLHPSTITGMLQRLEAAGYVQRAPHAGDRRRLQLHLTGAGERLNRPSQNRTVEHAARSTLARCNTRQRRAATNLIEHFTAELEKL